MKPCHYGKRIAGKSQSDATPTKEIRSDRIMAGQSTSRRGLFYFHRRNRYTIRPRVENSHVLAIVSIIRADLVGF